MLKRIDVGSEFWLKSSERFNGHYYDGLAVTPIDDTHCHVKIANLYSVELTEDGFYVKSPYRDENYKIVLPFGAKVVLADKKIYTYTRCTTEGLYWQVQK